MNSPRAFATLSVAFACAGAFACAAAFAYADELTPAPTGDQILARAKAAFRAHVRPPYVVYTVVRRDRHSGVPDFANSYTLKIWCRTTDRDALSRRVWNGKPYGGMENITVAFDGYVDPGPPTADVFERIVFASVSIVPDGASPQKAASSGVDTSSPAGTPSNPKGSPDPAASPGSLPTIGSVVVKDTEYRVARVARDGALWHLWLEPKRDRARNRIDELWVDATTYELRRLHLRDHLYLGLSGQSIDDEFDVRFTERDGLPLIASIHGQTAWGEFETDYTYKDVTFADALPDWYFQPKSYGSHRGEEPK